MFLISGDLVTPLKWISDEWGDWSCEQQHLNSSDWIRYYLDENYWIKTYYKQISVNSDTKGNLVVILKKKQSKHGVKLSNGWACTWNSSVECDKNLITTGYWLKKQSKYFISLLL